MSNNNGGPWGGGGNRGSGGDRGDGDRGGGGQRPGDGPQIPEIDDIVRKGQEQLRVLMGGRGRPGGPNGTGGGGPRMTGAAWVLVGIAAVAAWLFVSLYTVRPEEQSVELTFGQFSGIGEPGLNIAPWPVVTKQIVQTRRERSQTIGGGSGGDQGLMLTGDENIVDIDFQVVWNINDPARFLFTLRDPAETIEAVAESAMREIIAQSQLAPILNRDRGIIASQLQQQVQGTLDDYGSGINVVRVTFDKADPPQQVIDAFRDVQAAEQERDTSEKQADAYANRKLAEARGESAQLLEEAEGYRAQVVNEATGEASRFLAVLDEYQKAPEVTRRRLHIERMEEVYSNTNKILLDDSVAGGAGGNNVVPYLPLNELRRQSEGNN